MERNEDRPAVIGGLVLGHEEVQLGALPALQIAPAGPPLYCRPVSLIGDGLWIPMRLLPNPQAYRGGWPRLHRLVGLTRLGWAFVVSAVLWEVFALAFSECAGWGWDKGAFFFAWGLGVLAFGFYLRTSRQRPPVCRLFLGVNVLVLSILSFVVGTR